MARRLRKRSGSGSATLSWWQRWRPRRRYGVLGIVEVADLIPDRLPPRAIVVVEDGTSRHGAAFDCPCADGHRLLLPLASQGTKRWSIKGSRTCSLYPSIDVLDGERRCHFWLSKGSIRWVRRVERSYGNGRR